MSDILRTILKEDSDILTEEQKEMLYKNIISKTSNFKVTKKDNSRFKKE